MIRTLLEHQKNALSQSTAGRQILALNEKGRKRELVLSVLVALLLGSVVSLLTCILLVIFSSSIGFPGAAVFLIAWLTFSFSFWAVICETNFPIISDWSPVKDFSEQIKEVLKEHQRERKLFLNEPV